MFLLIELGRSLALLVSCARVVLISILVVAENCVSPVVDSIPIVLLDYGNVTIFPLFYEGVG